MSLILLLIGFTVLSSVLTGVLRRYAIRKEIIDIPNFRSSHTTPTPRGGGVSIVITFLMGLVIFPYLNVVSWEIALPFLLAGLIIAIIGFLDDHGHIRAEIRLFFHFLSAGIVVFGVSGLPELSFFGYKIDFSIIGWVLATVATVWILNLFNFMDGIDGIAGIEAFISTLVMGILNYFILDQMNIALLHFALAATVLGFLIWNFPPAKIFMGDAGSGFLGLMLAALLLLSSHISESLFWGWLVMLGVFIVDATYTLIHRLIRGEKPHQAHRSHAYQFASRRYGSHKKITLAVLLINVFWLAPISALIVIANIDGFTALLFAYIPLIFLAIKFSAGGDE